jgi:hypothetical protein
MDGVESGDYWIELYLMGLDVVCVRSVIWVEKWEKSRSVK